MNGVLNQLGVVCALFFGVVPAIAQPLNPSSSLPTIEQGKSLDCPAIQTALNTRSVPVIPEPSTPTHSLQALDGANTMMIKLIYLGLPGVILIGISLRTLHLHREIMRQRAFVESLERIWQRTVSY